MNIEIDTIPSNTFYLLQRIFILGPVSLCFFRPGDIFSSKYSIAIEDKSRNSCSTSCALIGDCSVVTYLRTL